MSRMVSGELYATYEHEDGSQLDRVGRQTARVQ